MADIGKIDEIEIANIAKVYGIDVANIASIYGASFVSGFYSKTIDNSCRFNDGDSAYLTRTPSAGNSRQMTFSCWYKRGDGATHDMLWAADANGSSGDLLQVGNTDGLAFGFRDAGDGFLIPSRKFRDVGSWYSIIVAIDTDQVTAADRVKIYINGERVSDFSTETYPVQNYDILGYNANRANYISKHGIANSSYIDGYLADVYFIDGQQLTSSDFGQFQGNVWTPKAFSGSYGTNGFHLDFADSGDIGNDVSGNANDWTPTNLVSTDQVSDSPTNNFCTLNPLTLTYYGAPTSISTLAEGNLELTMKDTACILGSYLLTSGKWYYEVKISTAVDVVVGYKDPGYPVDWIANSWSFYAYWGKKVEDGIQTAWDSPISAGDTIMVAVDIDNNKIWYGKNGSWLQSGDPGADTNPASTNVPSEIVPFVGGSTGGGNPVVYMNFGQDSTNVSTGNADDNGYGDFEYDVPAGFLALCSANLSDPAVEESDAGFKTILYTGDATNPHAITGAGHAPDLTVIKNRGQTDNWKVHDSILPVQDYLEWNTTTDDLTNANALVSLDSDGFTLGTGAGGWNDNTENFLSLNWKMGTTYGFDIQTFEGTGSIHIESHDLGSVPKVMILKRIDGGSNGAWTMYHHKTDLIAPEDFYIKLAAAKAVDDIAMWDDTKPTSSVFTVGTHNDVNQSGQTIMAYLFDEIEGFSKFGWWDGNGSTDGPFVYCGFRPSMIMFSNFAGVGTEHWFSVNTETTPYNGVGKDYYVTSNDVEGSGYHFDILSNGFKLRAGGNQENNASYNYLFMAWAEAPFKYSNAR